MNDDGKLNPHSVRLVVGTWLVIFISGVFYYQLEEYSSLSQQDLMPISIGIGAFFALIAMFYLVKLHHLIFKPKPEKAVYNGQ